jgi:hypothetical protein
MKGKKKYIKRNFALYRLSGMMGNLAHMRYEFRNDPALVLRIDAAMDAVNELKTFIKEGSQPRESISINAAYLLHGLGQKLSEHYTKEIQ